jgi:hypothetical protein
MIFKKHYFYFAKSIDDVGVCGVVKARNPNKGFDEARRIAEDYLETRNFTIQVFNLVK